MEGGREKEKKSVDINSVDINCLMAAGRRLTVDNASIHPAGDTGWQGLQNTWERGRRWS